MSLTVNTNMSAMIAQRSLFGANSEVSTSMQRLSTGLRINSAGDDAAGLSLSKKLGIQISAADMAKTNAQTSINMIQTAESDLSVIQDNLQRMRDLSVQAANGVYSTSERKMLSAEYNTRAAEVDRIAQSSSFSDRKLLDGSFTSMAIQVGTNNSANDQISLSTTTFRNFKAGNNGMPALAAAITTLALAQAAITAMDTAISAISNSRGAMGAVINRLQGSITRIDTRKENMTAANSIISDADIAKESADLTKNQVLKQAAISMLQQANQAPQAALTLLR